MSGQLYQRVCTALVGNLQITGLRMQFKIKKTLRQEPNTCDLKITNLSSQHRAALQTKGTLITLSAGYPSNQGVIFSGNARTIDHVRAGADWISHIQCGDGEVAYQFPRLSRSYGKGTPKLQVLTDLASAMGLNLGNLPARLAQGFPQGFPSFAKGFAAQGKASTQLTKILGDLGLRWSIQNGAVQVLADGEAVQGSIPLISPQSGLVGSPDHGSPTSTTARTLGSMIKVKTLLDQRLCCGGRFSLQSQSVSGTFRIEVLEHEGDTAGGSWYTMTESLPG